LLSRPGSSKTTFGPPSAGGSKNRFTVRHVYSISLSLPFLILILFLFFYFLDKQPYGSKCKDCKQTTTQNGAKYCHGTLPIKSLNRHVSILSWPPANAHPFLLLLSRLCIQEGTVFHLRKTDPGYHRLPNVQQMTYSSRKEFAEL
jgi:hypothetical protein